MTLTTTETPGGLTVVSLDPAPVEQAAVGEILDGMEPYRFLTLWFKRPDGGMRNWFAWTPGGDRLGDEIDDQALARGLDAADWITFTTEPYATTTTRGAIEIHAVDLRPLADHVRHGLPGCPAELRAKLRALVAYVAAQAPDRYEAPESGLPDWLGVGPHLVKKLRGA